MFQWLQVDVCSKSVPLMSKYIAFNVSFFAFIPSVLMFPPLILSSLSSSVCLSYLLLFSNPPTLFSSHLAQNPFICDCNLKWLADYLRSNPIETSGARCASPRRLANKRIGQIKSKKFRCSGRPLALCRCLQISLGLSLSLRQALLFLFHLSLTALLLPSLFLSAGSGYYLCIVPSTSYHI